MITADLHTHTAFSTDSEQPMEGAVEALLNAGMRTVCFTEHHDMDYPGGEFTLDTESYRSKLMELKEKYSNRIEILFGVELGIMDYLAPRLREYVKQWDFDFVIGSSHQVDGLDPYYPEYFEKYNDHNGILRYFESTLANISAFDDFDVYGHLDYIVRYSKAKSYQPSEYMEILDEILKKLISIGKGIELNTSGLKYGLGFAHPHQEVLKHYRELGGNIITVGSDGHKAEHYAWEFDAAAEILKSAGFEYYTIFRKRKPEFVKI